MKRPVTTQINVELWKQLTEYAKLNGLKIWYILELAILEWLEKKGKINHN